MPAGSCVRGPGTAFDMAEGPHSHDSLQTKSFAGRTLPAQTKTTQPALTRCTTHILWTVSKDPPRFPPVIQELHACTQNLAFLSLL